MKSSKLKKIFLLHLLIYAVLLNFHCGTQTSLVVACGSSSKTRDWNLPLCTGSTGSKLLDHQGSPSVKFLKCKWNFPRVVPSIAYNNIRMVTTSFFRKNFNSQKLIRLGKRILVLLPCIQISKEEENALIAPWCHN